MEKGLIVYSSQNGSTHKVAERIRDGLVEGGSSVELYKIGQSDSIQIEDYSFIGVGSPTYMFRPSYAVLDFLDRIGNLKNKKVFTFTTYGSELGDGAFWLRCRLRKMNAVIIDQLSCTGKHLFPGYTSRGFWFSPNRPTDRELEAAKEFGRKIASSLNGKHIPEVTEAVKGTHLISRIERFLTNRFLIRFVYSYFFFADQKKCTSCGMCRKVCPVHNVGMQEDGRIKWGRACILCLSCEIHCPRKAISTPISWIVFSPFLAYNIWRTKKLGIQYKSLRSPDCD
jgi:flavodoxin/NAD-dependent dihydropyrimidine dehydrogenase PreA subunit